MDTMSEEQAREDLRQLDEEATRRLEEEKYRYYEPTGKGEEFIKKFGSNEHFIVLYSAANGVGKTATGSVLLANMVWNNENPYFQDLSLFDDFPYRKRGRIMSDPTNIEKNIIPELKFWFPNQSTGRYWTKKGNKTFESIWETDTGHYFDLMSYEQDPGEFEGVTLGWAWFDEPPPETIFKATVARMRRGGVIFITATPLAGSAYLYDMFATGDYKVTMTNPEGVKVSYTRKIGYVEADIESACKEHGVRGHLAHENIMNIIAEYSEDEKQARIYGKFQHLVGLVFKQWSREVHTIKPFPVNEKEYCVYEMLDPHPRNPDAVQWIAIDKNGTKFIVDELYESVTSDGELARKIKQKADQYRVVKRIADPSAFNVNQHDNDGKSLADRLADLGLTYEPGTKQRTAADRRIADALQYRENNGYMVKAPEYYVFEDCTRTIFEFEHYQWDEWRGKTADDREPKEKPKDKDDHMIENTGRCLILEPSFEPFTINAPRVGKGGIDNLDPFD